MQSTWAMVDTLFAFWDLGGMGLDKILGTNTTCQGVSTCLTISAVFFIDLMWRVHTYVGGKGVAAFSSVHRGL